jgi:hypothetical protein
LDDFDDFDKEEGIKALFGEGSPKGRTLGDFLRDFDGEHLIRLNQFLSKQSYSMMRSLQNNLAEEFQPNRCSAFLLDAEVVRKRRQEVGVPDRDKKNTGQGKIRRASS